MTSREAMLREIRTSLKRPNGGAPPAPIRPRLVIPQVTRAQKIESLLAKVSALAGFTLHAKSMAEARDYVAKLIEGKQAVVSNEPFLAEAGIASLPGVQGGFTDEASVRDACAVTDYGISSATYALADTGSLVMISSQKEARLISLLPPVHVAIVPAERILSGLDELYSLVPKPGDLSSSMVLITGPSRTADIEQLLVRGVHGPGEIHVVVVD